MAPTADPGTLPQERTFSHTQWDEGAMDPWLQQVVKDNEQAAGRRKPSDRESYAVITHVGPIGVTVRVDWGRPPPNDPKVIEQLSAYHAAPVRPHSRIGEQW